MAGDPIDRAYLDINGSNVACDSIDIDFDDGADFVEAMTRDNEPLGVKRGNRKSTVTAEVTMQESDDVDFLDLWMNRTNIPIGVEYEGGKTIRFVRGELTKPAVKAKTGEDVKYSVELKVWQMVVI